MFVSKLFDKRDKCQFFIVHMPHYEGNIPSTIFYGSIFSEFLCIARYTLKLDHFLPRGSELYSRMLLQGANQSCINKQGSIRSSKISGHTKKCGKNYNELLKELKKYLFSK